MTFFGPTEVMRLNDPSKPGHWLNKSRIALYDATYDRDVGIH